MKRKVIGLTGGIGSGKSAILEAFAALGIPAYDCDSRTKALYREDAGLARSVADLLGEDVLGPDGFPDTKKMAARLFGNRPLLEKLESVVHPAVAQDFVKWADSQSSDIVIIESAILLEKPFFDKFADFVITVSAPEEVRIARAMRRDGATRGQIARRLANQWTDAQREARADMTLTTNDEAAALPRILELIEHLKHS
ncbi:MAG: dephospho-CoA kinase [Bacteroidales bacterium]|nr:dephospho-CoA kinase [Bacteroidales bacterium]MBQ7458566.1 dephospho-CoA kinase [Bacteroidales bacterium]